MVFSHQILQNFYWMNITLFSLRLQHYNNHSPLVTMPQFTTLQSFMVFKCSISKSFSNLFRTSFSISNIEVKNSYFNSYLDSVVHISLSNPHVTVFNRHFRSILQPKQAYIHCYFINCKTSNEDGGGALYFDTINGKILIQKSTFYDCYTTGKKSNGGAVLLIAGESEPSILDSCFTFCSTKLSGEGFFFHPDRMFGILNRTSFHQCPSKYFDSQSATFSMIGDSMIESINQSKGFGSKSPILHIHGDRVCTIYYFQAINNSIIKSAPMYEIIVESSSEHANAGRWNIICCNGNFSAIGYYEVQIFTHSELYVSGVGKKTKIICAKGNLTLSHCYFESKLETILKRGNITEEYNTQTLSSIDINRRFVKHCDMKTIQNVINENKSYTRYFVLIIICILGFITYKLFDKASKKRDEKIYERLAIPETV